MSPAEWAEECLKRLGIPVNQRRLDIVTKVLTEAMSVQRENDAKLADWWDSYKGPRMETLAWTIRAAELGKE